MTNKKKRDQAAVRQAALFRRRQEAGMTRLQIWVTEEQKERILTLLKIMESNEKTRG